MGTVQRLELQYRAADGWRMVRAFKNPVDALRDLANRLDGGAGEVHALTRDNALIPCEYTSASHVRFRIVVIVG